MNEDKVMDFTISATIASLKDAGGKHAVLNINITDVRSIFSDKDDQEIFDAVVAVFKNALGKKIGVERFLSEGKFVFERMDKDKVN